MLLAIFAHQKNHIGMSLLYKNVKQLVFDIDEFIDTVEQGVLVFKEGVVNYVNGEKASFADKIERVNRLEATADKLQRKIDDLAGAQEDA